MKQIAELLIAILKALGVDVAVKNKIKDERLNRADKKQKEILNAKDAKAAADELRRIFDA
jgi:hypothetical protein